MSRPQQSKRDRAKQRAEAERQRRNNPVTCAFCKRDLKSYERPEGICDGCLKDNRYFGPVSR